MAKFLIPLGLVVVGVAAWLALAPVSDAPPERAASAANAPPARAADPADPESADPDDDEPTVVDKAVVREGAAPRTPTVVNGLPEEAPPPPVHDPETGRLPADEDPRPVSPTGERYGRRHDTPMPKMNVARVKDSVRQFYGNLPASGAVPAKVTLADLFTDDVIRTLNYPPESKVKELGPYPIGDVKAFKDFLGQPDDSPIPLGVTVVTPDGQELRDYLMLTP